MVARLKLIVLQRIGTALMRGQALQIRATVTGTPGGSQAGSTFEPDSPKPRARGALRRACAGLPPAGSASAGARRGPRALLRRD